MLEEATLLLNEGRSAAAQDRFSAVLAKEPRNEKALYGTAICLIYDKKLEAAAEVLKRLLAANADHADAHNTLGIIYTELNQPDQARIHLLKAANSPLYGTPENAYLNLAKLELKLSDLTSALRYTDKGISLAPTFSHLYILKGIILEQMGSHKDAEYALLKGRNLALLKDDPDILMALGRVYRSLGEYDKALDYLEKAYIQSPNPEQQAFLKAQMEETRREHGSN